MILIISFVAQANTACGIETSFEEAVDAQKMALHRRIPLAVLKLVLQVRRNPISWLHRRIPLAVLKLRQPT